MAYIRSLSSRAKFLSRRYHPSVTHIFHHRDVDVEINPTPSVQQADYLLPRREFSFIQNRRCLDSSLSPKEFGASFCRHISTTTDHDELEKIKPMTEIADILNDSSVQVISSYTPAANEVAVAAADSVFPVAFFQHFIDAVHSFTGFNWWASIILTTLMIRGAMLPLRINAVKDARKLMLLSPAVQNVEKHMENMDMGSKACKDSKVMIECYMTLFRLLNGMFIGASVHICFFMGILNMAEKVPSFKFDGAYWLLDLSTPDSHYLFPFLTAMLILMRTEGRSNIEMFKRSPIARSSRDVWRAFTIISVPLTMYLPKAVFCYFITSQLFSEAFHIAVKLYGVNKFYGFPEKPLKNTKSENGRN